MDLMSSLLLFALALLPPALGRYNGYLPYDMGFNESMIIKRKPSIGKDILIMTPSASKQSDLRTVFADFSCKKCHNCMERTMKAHKTQNHMLDDYGKNEDLQTVPFKLDETRREKRKIKNDDTVKRNKNAKPKKSKAITVFKYVQDEKIYALKIKESNAQIAFEPNSTRVETTCQVYSVTKSVPCDSLEANVILTISNVKKSKRSKQEHKKDNVSAIFSAPATPILKKREVDDSQVPELYMPSIEDMY